MTNFHQGRHLPVRPLDATVPSQLKTVGRIVLFEICLYCDSSLRQGHGLPTQPQVTKELEDGTYLLEGMKFSMTGWWEIKLTIETAAGIDRVTFNTVVTSPDAKN